MEGRSIVWAVGVGLGIGGSPAVASANVLVYGADGDAFVEDVRAKIEGAGLDLGVVDAVDAREVILDAALLDGYDAVLTWGNQVYEDSVVTGDALADYSDAGGGVVVCAYATHDSFANGLKGRFVDEGYLPTTQGEFEADAQLAMVVVDPTHRVLDGVTSFDGGYDSGRAVGVEATEAAHVVATWSDEELLVVTKVPAARTVVVNAFPVSSDAWPAGWDAQTDGARLLANALWWSMGAVCGDGYVEDDETCDDANEDDADACVSCAPAICGDGVVHAGVEECDDGNADDVDGCTRACMVVEAGTSTGASDSGSSETSGPVDPTGGDGDDDGSAGGTQAGDASDPSGDASGTSDAPEVDATGSGCGCRSSGSPGAAVLLFALLCAGRRRRTRDPGATPIA
jgi:cysteine-rich repeat protein